MMHPGKKLLITVFTACTSLFAQIGNADGQFGFFSTPSARLLPRGMVLFSVTNSPARSLKNPGKTERVLSTNLIARPLELLEMGMLVKTVTESPDGQYTSPTFHLKLQFPRPDPSFPVLSVGAGELAAVKQPLGNLFFFVGAKTFRFVDGAFHIETGARYLRKKNPLDSASEEKLATPFFNLQLDLGSWSFLLENTSEKGNYEHAEVVLWYPWKNDRHPAWKNVSIGAGFSSGSSYPDQLDDAWVTVNMTTMPGFGISDSVDAGQYEKPPSREPWLWIDLSPSLEQAGSEFQSRVLLEQDVVVSSGIPGLYWVNGFGWQAWGTSKQHSLRKRNTWDRSFLQWGADRVWAAGPMLIAQPIFFAGQLSGDILGAGLRQQLSWLDWRSMTVDISLSLEDSWSATSFVPIHPRLEGFFENFQSYAEGGKNTQGEIFGDLVLRQTLGRGFLQFRSGWVEGSHFRAGLDFSVNLSGLFQMNTGGIHISGSPNWRQEQDLRIHGSKVSWSGNTFQRLFRSPWRSHEVREALEFHTPLRLNCKKLPKERWTTLDSLHCSRSDSDKDLVMDRDDLCIEQAEDFDGFQDSDGCPDRDDDRDQIPDILDACPNQAEDFDGFQDRDGCPEPDNDSDGIEDTVDACPDMAEDPDGFDDNDGCPDLDNDGDGVADMEDSCPRSYAPNGRNGCPLLDPTLEKE